MQLCFLVHQWHMALEEGAHVQSVFLDLSKAYDRISINALLSKLSLIGFNYSVLEWFANFLQRREQYVQLNGASSKWQIPKSGIPQGTVLGPVLFLIFINDRPQSTRNQCSIFADDTSLHTAGKSTASSCATVSADLDAAATWADRWGMLFSPPPPPPPKSKHISIGKKARQSPPVSMRGVLIPQVRTHKHLGLVLNESLTWSDHVSSVYRLCPNDWDPAMPRRNNSFTSSEVDLHRSYPPLHVVCVRSVERRAHRMSPTPTRLICKKKHSLSLPPLEKRFEYHKLVLFYRVRANLAPIYLSSLVPPLTSTKSGYSFRKNPILSPLQKVCNVKQLFAPCNHFLERPPSRGAVIKHVVNIKKIDWELTFHCKHWHRFFFLFFYICSTLFSPLYFSFHLFLSSVFILPGISSFPSCSLPSSQERSPDK